MILQPGLTHRDYNKDFDETSATSLWYTALTAYVATYLPKLMQQTGTQHLLLQWLYLTLGKFWDHLTDLTALQDPSSLQTYDHSPTKVKYRDEPKNRQHRLGLSQYLSCSTNYFQRLTLESCYTNFEKMPLNRCHQLPGPYNLFIHDGNETDFRSGCRNVSHQQQFFSVILEQEWEMEWRINRVLVSMLNGY